MFVKFVPFDVFIAGKVLRDLQELKELVKLVTLEVLNKGTSESRKQLEKTLEKSDTLPVSKRFTFKSL